jgi:hypothetical protein
MSFENVNKLVDFLGEKLRFSSREKTEHDTVLEAYEKICDFDSVKAYNLEMKLRKGLRFRSLEHILDTIRNTPNWL